MIAGCYTPVMKLNRSGTNPWPANSLKLVKNPVQLTTLVLQTRVESLYTFRLKRCHWQTQDPLPLLSSSFRLGLCLTQFVDASKKWLGRVGHYAD